ncbi:MAG TPA: hypothetical protein VK578_10075 [Edaphobacter sp.]|nr:hypothetical protein [Edaphobacter sp.]
MAVFKRGKFYHYQFMVDGQPYRGSTKETVKARAEQVEAVFKAEAKGFKEHRSARARRLYCCCTLTAF